MPENLDSPSDKSASYAHTQWYDNRCIGCTHQFQSRTGSLTAASELGETVTAVCLVCGTAISSGRNETARQSGVIL